MAQTLACLRGWHVALAQAELNALIPQAEFAKLSPRLLSTFDDFYGKMVTTLDCSSGIQCFLHDAHVVEYTPENIRKFLDNVSVSLEDFAHRGSLAVRTLRIAGKIADFSTRTLAGQIGGIATDLGYSINLDEPDYEVGLIADGASNIVACGWLIGDFDDSIGTATRRATERPFFRPISLDPRLARLCVNLACGPIDDQAVLDPMTGTGGFAMEAITMGRNCLAVDMDDMMVTGTMENIAWALGDKTAGADYQVITGDACHLNRVVPDDWQGRISGVVLDPPYGRNSHGSQSHNDLIKSTIMSCRRVVNETARLVLIVPIKPTGSEEITLLHGNWDDFSRMLSKAGAELINQWQEHVHGSLSRLILLASVAPLN